MDRVVRIEARPHHRLYVEFEDGVRGEYDLSTRLHGPMFEPLRDPEYFARVTLSEWGVPVWPNGADVAPDALYERLIATLPGEASIARDERPPVPPKPAR